MKYVDGGILTDLVESTYLDSKIWLQDKYLVIPTKGTKLCKSCNEVKFTSEYADALVNEYVDGCVPVCNDCYRSRRSKKFLTTMRVCSKCAKSKQLKEFDLALEGNDYSLNVVLRKCKRCAR